MTGDLCRQLGLLAVMAVVAGASRISSEMAKHGIMLEGFHADEMWQGNGGAHWITCPVLLN